MQALSLSLIKHDVIIKALRQNLRVISSWHIGVPEFMLKQYLQACIINITVRNLVGFMLHKNVCNVITPAVVRSWVCLHDPYVNNAFSQWSLHWGRKVIRFWVQKAPSVPSLLMAPLCASLSSSVRWQLYHLFYWVSMKIRNGEYRVLRPYAAGKQQLLLISSCTHTPYWFS